MSLVTSLSPHEALDKARIEWNLRDIIENRPALSRWHPACTCIPFRVLLHPMTTTVFVLYGATASVSVEVTK